MARSKDLGTTFWQVHFTVIDSTLDSQLSDWILNYTWRLDEQMASYIDAID